MKKGKKGKNKQERITTMKKKLEEITKKPIEELTVPEIEKIIEEEGHCLNHWVKGKLLRKIKMIENGD